MKFVKFRELAYKWLFFLGAVLGGVAVLLIFLFVGLEGLPLLFKVGIRDFLFSSDWLPTKGRFGILPLIVGSLLVTVFSLGIGGTAAILLAIFLAEVAPRWMRKSMRPVVNLLAGIPSVVYGFLGILIVVPMVNEIDGPNYVGFGIFSASLVLSLMILPTIASVAENAIRAVPKDYRDASYAIGATQWQTIVKVVVPAAYSGIATAVILGMARAVGETMAVLMVIGNSPVIPKSAFSSSTTLTSIIALDMAYASGDHRMALFVIGTILFIFTSMLIAVAHKYFSGRAP